MRLAEVNAVGLEDSVKFVSIGHLTCLELGEHELIVDADLKSSGLPQPSCNHVRDQEATQDVSHLGLLHFF